MVAIEARNSFRVDRFEAIELDITNIIDLNIRSNAKKEWMRKYRVFSDAKQVLKS